MSDHIIISNISDDPFAIDIGHMCGQREDISDIISMKVYANTEFCPRFISDEQDMDHIGSHLDGKTVIVCSAAGPNNTRGALAMRNMILARTAKDNGAKRVILVEPDLFFSAQDRGPHRGVGEQQRTALDLKKFDGQPFTAKLYAELLKTAGVDVVITVHNHSLKVQRIFSDLFGGQFHNLYPADLYADYIKSSDMLMTGKRGDNLVLCSPDEGAVSFVDAVWEVLALPRCARIVMHKERSGERQVKVSIRPGSDLSLQSIENKHVIVLDDMVRTGSTIVECCRVLRQGNPGRICFGVTHFLAGPESRENLNSKYIDEILTLNTVPSVLNRDSQGRLRKKMVVLKIEKWIARFLLNYLALDASQFANDFYSIDMSSKNPRWRSHNGTHSSKP